MAKKRRSAPSATTTPFAVRIPNALLARVQMTARTVQTGETCAYVRDTTPAALKAFVLQALRDQVSARTAHNRAPAARPDAAYFDFANPPAAVIITAWARDRVTRLDAVPQYTGRAPTSRPLRFVLNYTRKVVDQTASAPAGDPARA